ncbi:hypothetical protein KEM60_02675 [Austwickia sp. TVS 96-490-7B]|uniref:TM0106 family RecB-like putative nuclease n=1 Tax=Austwickia sp. TVS 96-490-7B TaxID=2830843 RepID=UPI001C56CA73|nr:TM0106 family RecB-like putative nuclease [Austwickia sp. TVS 96-490-7B]MBW3086454.1 hypothetical protein [Austwickia sp. TVS 96-490-7B]
MFARGGRVVLSPTDLSTFLGCAHASSLDLQVARGERSRPAVGVDEQLRLIADQGMAHERAYVQRLRDRGLEVVEIPRDQDLELAESWTVAAMQAGADVVYQGTLFDGTWLGYADFLIRRDGVPSSLGDWCYDLVDTKLARHLSAAALLQLATYARRVETLQGRPPVSLTVVTGDGVERPFRVDDVAAYAARARAGLEWFVAAGDLLGMDGDLAVGSADQLQTRPEPVAQCARCRWHDECAARWQAQDDLSLVAGMRQGHRAALRAAGIDTVAALAAHPGAQEAPVPGISRAMVDKLGAQARIQVAERIDGRARYELLPHVPGRGLARLPAPDPGDLYLDFEGDPFAGDGAGREYLAGVYDREGGFHTWWAHDEAAEAELVSGLLRFLVEAWQQHPGMHVYHYAPYEQSALKRLTGRYGVGEADLDALLRGGRFVDLYQVVKQGLIIGKPSYSIKKMEDLYWGHVRHGEGDEVADALSSVVEYERYLTSGDEQILTRIAEYNREDVRSTLALHDWLEERRDELVAHVADVSGPPVERPVEVESTTAGESPAAAAERDLADRLVASGHDLFAGLVGWHRREDRPDWWDFFRRAESSDDELVDDAAAVGRVSAPEPAGEKLTKTGRVSSRLWRYGFPPQAARLEVGKALYDVDARSSCGTVVRADGDAGWVVLAKAASADPAVPRGLMPPGPIDNAVLRESLSRQGEALLAGGRPAGAALVDRIVPSGLALLPGESPAEAVVRVGSALDGEVLAVQGPPGAGKTYAASRLIRALWESGLRVGVTAQSHAVIRNLLGEIGLPAWHKVGGAVAADQDPSGVVEVADNGAVAAGLADGSVRLVGGTAWLWARPDLAESVDVLVIDEAGQFSLANAVAVAGAARSVVLLGDPQQLTQPTKAEHPYGAGVSALGHLIGDHEVIPPDRGLFLDVTYRMHPVITQFCSTVSYEGLLRSAPGRERQRVDAPGVLAGSGLRQVPVVHHGNVQDSPQEAQVVARLVADLLQGSWVDAEGVRHPMGGDDVLVVAPYNAHVDRLRAAVPAGVRVGTVDAFQGQQAPVVIYATGSSSAAEAPRGVSFLYDVHRLNVAVSRARALAVWVGSPALLEAVVGTPEQVRLVNALCTFAAGASEVSVP